MIVAVNGMAAGGCLALAMAGDLVLAAESATFTMAYTIAGLSPDGSTTYFSSALHRPPATAGDALHQSGFSAQEALDWGMVTKVVPDSALRTEALALAGILAEGPLSSHASIKQLLLTSFQNGLETQMEIDGRLIAGAASSPDGQEGIRALSSAGRRTSDSTRPGGTLGRRQKLGERNRLPGPLPPLFG